MAPSDPEVIVDQSKQSVCREGNGPASGLLFLQTDSSFEMGIMDDFLPVLKQSSHQVLQNSALKYHE